MANFITMYKKETLIEEAKIAKQESKYIEFKESFDVDSKGEWCEVIKDVVAMANSGGGIIVFGLRSDGTPSGFDCSKILSLDPSLVSGKIGSYTRTVFEDFQIEVVIKEDNKLAGLIIQGIKIPLVFEKPGTYPIDGGKQKTAFGQGTIYFRHGAKSETGNADDLKNAFEARLRESTNDSISQKLQNLQNSNKPSLKVKDQRYMFSSEYFVTIENVGSDLYDLSIDSNQSQGIFSFNITNKPKNLATGGCFEFRFSQTKQQGTLVTDKIIFNYKDENGKKYSQPLVMMFRDKGIYFEPSSIVQLSTLDQLAELSNEACKILNVVSKDKDGQLLYISQFGKFKRLTSNRRDVFNAEIKKDPKEKAVWVHAISELIEKGLLKDSDGKEKGIVYHLTKKGFEWADVLIVNEMRVV